MGEQNRRAVELETPPGEVAPTRPHDATPPDSLPPDSAGDRALSNEADERQTRRQAPDNAWPGEGSETDSIG
jgi:hypothetical protein